MALDNMYGGLKVTNLICIIVLMGYMTTYFFLLYKYPHSTYKIENKKI